MPIWYEDINKNRPNFMENFHEVECTGGWESFSKNNEQSAREIYSGLKSMKIAWKWGLLNT